MTFIDHIEEEIEILKAELKQTFVSSSKDDLWRKIDALNAVLDLYD